ncbi:MAG TPA: hypothetical protein VGF41_07175, partial [Myxococcaceae bacterium]
MALCQRGTAVTGLLNGMNLVGQVDGVSLSFTLDEGSDCGPAGARSGFVSELADRDRLTVHWVESTVHETIPAFRCP